MMLKSGLMIMPTREATPLIVSVHHRRSVAREVLRHGDREHAEVAVREEVRRLPAIGIARFEVLFGPIGISTSWVQLRL